MKLNIISAIIGIMVAGAATATLAKPGDNYNLTAGGCLPGDTVNNPAKGGWHCTEKKSFNPGGNVVDRKAETKAGNTLPGSRPAQQAPVEPSSVAKPPIPTASAK